MFSVPFKKILLSFLSVVIFHLLVLTEYQTNMNQHTFRFSEDKFFVFELILQYRFPPLILVVRI